MNINVLRWTLGLLFVLALIAATNLMDKRNFNQMSGAIETMYNDRLVANDIIFELSMLTHEKELALASDNVDLYRSKVQAINVKIDQLVAQFATTKLTDDEVVAFEKLQRDLDALKRMEAKWHAESIAVVGTDEPQHIPSQLTHIQQDLQVLSEIQIVEGKRQLHLGKSAMRSIDFLTSMELYVLIIIGIVVQLILLSDFKSQKMKRFIDLSTWSKN